MKKIKVKIKNKFKYYLLIKYKLFKYIKTYPNIKQNIKIIFITNNFLYKKYYEYITKILKKNNIKFKYYLIPDGESSKSIIILNNIITFLLNNNYNKDSIIISFGGGVIGDITGFTASIYLRGIEYIHIPTTLLSQVDSSIGGKTGINHALGKNMIGTYYQPKSVLIDTYFLKSLSKKEILSGIAEIIKYSIIFDHNFFNFIEKNYEKILNLEKKIIDLCIYKCCKFKTLIVNSDEKDKKERIKLNLGHTYGHAIETFVGYGNWTHGEAISVGIIMSCNLSYLMKKINLKNYIRIKNILLKFNLPIIGPKNMTHKDYIKYMLKDKKNTNNKINIIIPNKIGKVKIIKNVSLNLIKKSINNINL